MKKTIAFIAVAMLLPIWVLAQNRLQVIVSDESGMRLPGVSLQISGSGIAGQTADDGSFLFENLTQRQFRLTVSYLGYKTQELPVDLSATSALQVSLEQTTYLTDDVVVQATRAGQHTGTTYKNLSKADIAKNNLGQEVSYLLNQTPSVVVSSDAGTGIGHTSLTIRGSDAARTNVTLNGIPYNDPESLGTFWVNMPDFSSSIDNMQIQRGVGTSTNGAGAFGASINIQTNVRVDSAYAEIDNSAGSFQTLKNTVKLGSGLINERFSFDARLSRVVSDGYMDHGEADRAADLKSFFVSGAWYGERSLLRANVFSGTQKTYQSWNGVPEELLKSDRTYNEFTYKDQTDNYLQTHYQLLYSNQLTSSFLLNGALHYTRGEGYYEEYKNGQRLTNYGLSEIVLGGETIEKTDLIRQRWLDNDFYGFTYSLAYKPLGKLSATLGGGYNIYKGDHFGEVIWAQYASDGALGDRYYMNDATKKDFNSFLKLEYTQEALSVFADLQYRNVDYSYEGINRDLSPLQQQVNLNFFNPKLGLSYKLTPSSLAYASIAVANKEPIRRDYTDSSPDSQPRPERLTDIEVGWKYSGASAQLSVNGYAMLYKDQLVTTGFINDVGSAVRLNVGDSYRAGIEVDGKWSPFENFNWSLAAALSENKIKDYSYFIDLLDENYDPVGQEEFHLDKTTIALSPGIVVSNEFSYRLHPGITASLISKHVGRQYLDNTQSRLKSVDAYFLNDLRLQYITRVKGLKQLGLTLRVNNIFDVLYESSGYTYGYFNAQRQLEEYNYYFPQATRNYMVGLNVKF